MNRILIVEDEPLITEAYLFILKDLQKKNKIPAFLSRVCYSYDEGEATILKMAQKNEVPVACILDFRLNPRNCEERNGLELGKMIRNYFPNCKIILITSIADKYIYHTIIESLNPSAFLIKNEVNYKKTGEDILSVLEGRLVYSKSVNDFVRNNPYSKYQLDGKDVQIVQLLRKRLSIREIADCLTMSVSGIEYKKRRLAEKLGIKSSDINAILKVFEERLEIS